MEPSTAFIMAAAHCESVLVQTAGQSGRSKGPKHQSAASRKRLGLGYIYTGRTKECWTLGNTQVQGIPQVGSVEGSTKGDALP